MFIPKEENLTFKLSHKCLGKGKSMYTFSAQRRRISAFRSPRLLALPTEAWRGAEIRRHSVENVYINLPRP
jgi:hypothetical protein